MPNLSQNVKFTAKFWYKYDCLFSTDLIALEKQGLIMTGKQHELNNNRGISLLEEIVNSKHKVATQLFPYMNIIRYTAARKMDANMLFD